MAGNREGGIKSAKKILASDPDFYRKIGRIGGKKSTKGGFYADRNRASLAGKLGGKLGGKMSKRGHKLIKIDGNYAYYVINSTGATKKVRI